jgi:DNA-binding XRE family transcriptional regulator
LKETAMTKPPYPQNEPGIIYHSFPNDEPLVQAELIKMGRKTLEWSRLDLAAAANIPERTVKKVEEDGSGRHKELIALLRATLERHGVRFEPGMVTSWQASDLEDLAEARKRDVTRAGYTDATATEAWVRRRGRWPRWHPKTYR